MPSDDAKSDSKDAPNSHPGLPLGSWMWKQARKLVIFVIGSTVLLIGIAMMVLPGPAFIVIPIGLTILATEFVWAKRLLNYAKRQVGKLTTKQPPQNKTE